MKTILGLIFFLGSLAPVAKAEQKIAAAPKTAAYELKLELSVDGKLVASPSLKVNAGEKAVIRQKGDDGVNYSIEVFLHPDVNAKKVKMDFEVASENAEGVREVLEKLQVITKERKGATLTVNKSDGSEKMALKVWAKKAKK